MKKKIQLYNDLITNRVFIEMDLSEGIEKVDKMMSLLVQNGFNTFSFNIFNWDNCDRYLELSEKYSGRPVHLGISSHNPLILIKLMENMPSFIIGILYNEEIHRKANLLAIPYIATCETLGEIDSSIQTGADFIKMNSSVIYADEIIGNDRICIMPSSIEKNITEVPTNYISNIQLTDLKDNKLKEHLKLCTSIRQSLLNVNEDIAEVNRLPQENSGEIMKSTVLRNVTVNDEKQISPDQLNQIIQMLHQQNKLK